MTPKYSIIIPVYNAEKTLSECLKSIIEQPVQNIEIILIDDGSCDASPSICIQYASVDKRIIAVHQENAGVSCARNKGIDIARGEWITFVDSDDIVLPGYLSEFDKQENKADLTYFGNIFHSHDGCDAIYSLPTKRFVGRIEIERAMLMLKSNVVNYGYYGYTWNKFFRSSIIKEHNIRFTQGLYYREDEIFTNEYIAHINSLATLSCIGYDYRYTLSGQGGRKTSIDNWRKYYESAKHFLFYVTNEELQRYEYKFVVESCYRSFEMETNDVIYLQYLEEMLDIVKRYGHLYPQMGKRDYYSSILDYYKDKHAKRRIDVLMMKKRLKSIFLKHLDDLK